MAATLELVSPADNYNQSLVGNVHPPDWQNPTPKGRYNLVVIGAGTAGLVSAAGAAALGARVALIERHLMGGDCLNYGCVPSKGIIRAARAAYALREASEFGIRLCGEPEISFSAVMERMRRIRSEISSHDSARRFTDLGVDVYIGSARFLGPDAVTVEGTRLDFRRAIIASGARATGLPVPGIAETGFLTNETIFSLTELPRRLIVIGAGPIGCEMAQTFRRFGSEVTLINRGPQLLPREDADAAEILRRQFEREGIHLVLGTKLARVQRQAGAKAVVFDQGRGEDVVIGDEILVAVGRAPHIEGLDLEKAGVEFTRTGVAVDDRLRTSNPRIYAAGDICSSYKFTHAAEAMARIALQNALFFGRKKASELVIPWTTYTDPEIAHVGLNEKEARKKGYEVETITQTLAENDRALLDGEAEGFARVHAKKQNGQILGATLVSRHAGESIGELVLAMAQHLPVSRLSGVIHPYPTQAETIKRLGDAAMRTRLKPWIRRLFERFFAVWR